MRFARENHFRYPYRDWPAPRSLRAHAKQSMSRSRNRRATHRGRRVTRDDGLCAGGLGRRAHRARQAKWILGSGPPWKPGEPLKLLFAGYNGARNTGSDVRVEEMLRQVGRVLGAQNVSAQRHDTRFSTAPADISAGAEQVKPPDVFPPFLYRDVSRHDGVMACEGSMFKSKLADALTTMMIGALGLATAENKLSVGYGGDADRMSPTLAKLCGRYCSHSLLIARSPGSQAALLEQGIPSELGTDTAWTFEPAWPRIRPQSTTRGGMGRRDARAGGLRQRSILLAREAVSGKLWSALLTGAYKNSQYRTFYFHKAGPDVDAALRAFSYRDWPRRGSLSQTT